MTELPMDCWAQRRDICLTLEEGPGGLSPIDSFIVLLAAREVVTPEQLRQTLVYKFVPAISWLQNKTNDTAKGGSKVFFRLCPKSQRIFVVVQQKICHYEAWALLASLPRILVPFCGSCQPRLSLGPAGLTPRGLAHYGPTLFCLPLSLQPSLADQGHDICQRWKGIVKSQKVSLRPIPAWQGH